VPTEFEAQRTKEHAVDDGKDGGRRADPERESGNGHRSERRRAPQQPNGVAGGPAPVLSSFPS